MAASETPPHIFDRALMRNRRARALGQPQFPDFLYQAAAAGIADRLDLTLRSFERALALGAAAAPLAQVMARSGKFGHVITADRSPRGPAGPVDIVIDEEALPFAPASLDAVIAGPMLEFANDLPGALAQIARALKPDGLFLAVLFGGETLSELRASWFAAETEITGGVSPRVAPFADVRELGRLLQRANLALPVADVDRLTVRYPSGLAVMAELKAMGLANALAARRRSPVTRTLAGARRQHLRGAFLRSGRPGPRHVRPRHPHRLGPGRDPAEAAEARQRQRPPRRRPRHHRAQAEALTWMSHCQAAPHPGPPPRGGGEQKERSAPSPSWGDWRWIRFPMHLAA
jgi:SAM-dependent methyltransferase